MSAKLQSDRPRDLWIPWTIAAVFLAFLGVPVGMSVIAAGSDPGLVVGVPGTKLAGSYVMDAGPAPGLELSVVGRRPGWIEIQATFRSSDTMSGAPGGITAMLQRATDAKADQAVQFTPISAQAWRATVAVPGPGAWNIAVQVQDGAGRVAAATLRL